MKHIGRISKVRVSYGALNWWTMSGSIAIMLIGGLGTYVGFAGKAE